MWILDYIWKGEKYFKNWGRGEMVKFEYEPSLIVLTSWFCHCMLVVNIRGRWVKDIHELSRFGLVLEFF